MQVDQNAVDQQMQEQRLSKNAKYHEIYEKQKGKCYQQYVKLTFIHCNSSTTF